VYLNINNSGKASELKPEDQKRIVESPRSGIDPNGTQIKVNMNDIEDES